MTGVQTCALPIYADGDPQLKWKEEAAEVKKDTRQVLGLAEDGLEFVPCGDRVGRKDKFLFEVKLRDPVELTVTFEAKGLDLARGNYVGGDDGVLFCVVAGN